MDSLLSLFNYGCQYQPCTGKSEVTNVKCEAGCCNIQWRCSNTGTWASSSLLCNKSAKDIYAISIVLAAGILITGNNFDKIDLLCKFLNLNIISQSTYMRIQKLYVRSFWEEMRTNVWDILSKESVVLCGDGRNDSPGHNAKYCSYFLMEQFLEVIIDMDIVDMRETSGISTNMEVFGLKRLLERLAGKIIMSEIVTDASTSVIALVKKMKGN